jgi:hypothetical protein
MFHKDIRVIPGILGTSFIIILWWVSLWLIVEESISFISGDKRHVKMSICVMIIVILTVYAHVDTTFIHKL